MCFDFDFGQTAAVADDDPFSALPQTGDDDDVAETRPQPKAVRSCKAVVKDQEGYGANVSTEPCYLFHEANTDTCNDGQFRLSH